MNSDEPRTTPVNPEFRFCAVCAYPLEILSDRAGGDAEYQHIRASMAADHIAVPVKLEEITPNQRCDFCDDEEDTSFVVLATNFDTPTPHGALRSHGHWTACTICAGAIRRGRWNDVITRARDAAKRNGLNVPRRHYVDVYDRLQAHMIDIVTDQEWRERWYYKEID